MTIAVRAAITSRLHVGGQVWRRAHPARRTHSHSAAATVAGAPIARGERVLFVDRTSAGPVIVATGWAIYQRAGGIERQWLRLGWEDVGRIGWNRGTGLLTLTSYNGAPTMLLSLPDGERLVDLARERVTATRLAAVQVWHHGRNCAKIVARRKPDTDDVTWVVAFSEAADAANPAIQAEIELSIAELQSQIGR